MSDMLERLRRLHSLRPKAREIRPEPEPASAGTAAAPGSSPLAVPDAEWELVNDLGRCLVREVHCPPELERGGVRLAQVPMCTPAGLAPLFPRLGLDAAPRLETMAFVDTETTGLGGAQTFAFLVGVGAFEADSTGKLRTFRVRQFFARHPGEEAAMLQALGEYLDTFQGLVTFNGRGFDVPLLRTRYHLLGRMDPRFPGPPLLLDPDTPHLDLLVPARRLWRRRLGSCALANLEQRLLGHRRSGADVPGALIPLLYTRYLTHGDLTALHGVFYHNVEDIVSMAALAGHLCGRVLPAPEAPPTAQPAADLFSLARLHEELGQTAQAEALYRAALDAPGEDDLRGEIFHALGRLLKRQGRWDEAAAVWQRWLSTVPGADPRPYVELAKLCEWQTGDLAQAEMWTAWALHELEQVPPARRASTILDELRHRLARIRRKRGRNEA